MPNEVVVARCIEMGWYTIENNSTVRQTAEVFKVSCSTVYNELTKKLPKAFPQLAEEVQKVLENNKKNSSYRGVAATRKRYMKMKAE